MNIIIPEQPDLFDELHYGELPKEVKDILETLHEEDYTECERVQKELNAIGYDFEYYLDAIPFNLHKIKK